MTDKAQFPSMSSLSASSTALDAIGKGDLTGKNVVITGTTSGIGFESALAFATAKANVYMIVRNEEKAKEAKKQISEKTGNENIHYIICDLASLKSVSKAADEFLNLKVPVHILLLNAGIMSSTSYQTEDNYESHFATNHLAHFLLTQKIFPALKDGQPSRVVVVSSAVHSSGDFSFKNLGQKNGPSGINAYSVSKACNIHFANELNRRCKDSGLKITANSLHPGYVATDLFSSGGGFIGVTMGFFSKIAGKSVQEGASTQVMVATSPELEGVGGKYFSDCKEVKPSSHALDMEVSKKLWDVSVNMVGLKESLI